MALGHTIFLSNGRIFIFNRAPKAAQSCIIVGAATFVGLLSGRLISQLGRASSERIPSGELAGIAR